MRAGTTVRRSNDTRVTFTLTGALMKQLAPRLSQGGSPIHSTPAVSVVIPTFNRMDWLPQAVASVLGQTWRDFELLIVDDGSTDGTATWLAGLTDPRVHVIRLPHSGNVARVRNAGAARARGTFLCFLDSDDVWLQRKLEVQLTQAARHPGTWSYTRYEHMDERGRRIPPRSGEWRAASGRIAMQLIGMKAAVSIVTVLVPRDLFRELGGFDERPRIREDYVFLVRLAVRAEVVSLSECLVLVRDHPARSTRALRGAEPFLIGARSCDVLLESLEHEEDRRAARRRRARYLAEAGAAHMKRGALGRALACFLQAVRPDAV